MPKIIQRILRASGAAGRPGKVVTKNVGGFPLKMNADHVLPRILQKNPNYSANLPRLAARAREKHPRLAVLDVGANIGDGVALIRGKVQCPIICIEGDPFYFSLLQENLKQFAETWAYNLFLGERTEGVAGVIRKSEGTLRIAAAGAESGTIQTTTLDAFFSRHPEYENVKLIKTDTDGYDLKILRGGMKFIERNRPVLFLEYDREYLEATGDDGLSTLKQLRGLGYEDILFYDNSGRFLVRTTLEAEDTVTDLHDYIFAKRAPFPYYDVCLFHRDDRDVARSFADSERLLNKKP